MDDTSIVVGGDAARAAAARKVRALLAQAERTPYPAEAEAATEKATELMVRYRVDEALVAAVTPEESAVIETLTIVIPPGPYVGVRTTLLAAISSAFGSKVVYTSTWNGRATEVLGFSSDLDRIELLYTSLLAQATAAANASKTPRGQSAVSWRRSFLAGFAQRVSERLAEQTAAAVAATDETVGEEAGPMSSSVALVLADRSAAVSEEYQRRYGRLSAGRRGATVSRSAAAQGRSAADRADLESDRRVTGGGTKELGRARRR